MNTLIRFIAAGVVLALLAGCTGYTEAQRGWANMMYDVQGKPELKQPSPAKKGK